MMGSAGAVYLSLGSNVGDRAAHLRRAFRALASLPGTRLVKASRFYQTSPFGVRGQRDYLNAAAQLRTRLSPMGLLVHLKTIEAGEGRGTLRRWAPRPLDIDILFYGKLRLRNDFLEVPHPGWRERLFVLAPLGEIAPAFRPPGGGGSTAKQLLARLKAPGQRARII